jgi:hypothetical protein
MSEGQRIARARDAWLNSREGQRCQDGEPRAEYLRNRLELAFLAGWDACKRDEALTDHGGQDG